MKSVDDSFVLDFIRAFYVLVAPVTVALVTVVDHL